MKLCYLLLLFAAVPIDVLGEDDLARKCRQWLPGCNCYDAVVVGGVQCWDTKDLFTNVQVLNGLVFKVNTTFEIEIKGGTKFLPPNALEGLNMFRLTIEDSSTAYVDDHAFDGVMKLRRFLVRCSSIKNVPDFRSVQDSLENLNLDNSQLTKLEGNGLKDLSRLVSVSFLNNSIQQVAPDVFTGTDNIIVFDLSYNKLTSLPPHLFDTWKKLRKVALSHNNLLHVNQLFVHARPKFIYLDFNNISDLDNVLHPNLVNLTTLLIGHNPIERVTPSTFNRNTPNIHFIYLDHCKIRTFDVEHYQNLSKLVTLDLKYNELESIPHQNINFGRNIEFMLEGNLIQNFSGEISHSVTRFYMSDNRMQSLGTLLQNSRLTEVSVSRNRLQQLKTEDFSGLKGLRVFRLNDNHIKWIDRKSFAKIRNDFHYLDFGSNLLTSLNGSVMYLSQLKYLNLTSNLIATFEEGEFAGLNELSELYLSNNQIITLGELQQLPELQFLVLTKNRIQTLKEEQIPKTLQYLYLMDNPIVCDCQLLPFVRWLNSSGSPETDVPLCLPRPHNSSISSNSHSCPENCSCYCTKDTNKYFMSMDCSSKNMSTLPPLLKNETLHSRGELFLVKTFLQRRLVESSLNLDTDIEIVDTLEGINLSNNSLVSLQEARLPPPLRHLRLQKNLLRSLPPSFLTSFPFLRRVSLADNPWRCDCNTVDFRKWILSKIDIIEDVNKTFCGKVSDSEKSELENKAIWTLNDRDLCPAEIDLVFSITFGLIACILVLTVSQIFYVHYKMQIKAWLYAHGVTWLKEKDIDSGRYFDAFISYSHKEENFVITEIISAIEDKNPNIRLCLDYKHFMPGEYIHKSIMSAVKNSKRTVLILSRDFLESRWCLMEFRAAHVQALKDNTHRIIVIKVGELPERIDPSIQLYLDSTTYLTWGDKYFWNNLMYVLPASGHTNEMESSLMMTSVCNEDPEYVPLLSI